MKEDHSHSAADDADSPWLQGEMPVETAEQAARRAERMRAFARDFPEWHEFSFRRMLKLMAETAKSGLWTILKPVIAFGIAFGVFWLATGESFIDDDDAPVSKYHFDVDAALDESRRSMAEIRKQFDEWAEWVAKCECEKCTGRANLSREFLVAFYGSEDMLQPWHSWQIDALEIGEERRPMSELMKNQKTSQPSHRKAQLRV